MGREKRPVTMSPAFSRFWQARHPRERRILLAGALVLSALVIWLLLVEPALQARSRWHKELPALRDQLAQMRALSADIGSLPASDAAAATELSPATIERSLDAQGLKAQSLKLADDQLDVSFTDIPFASLAEWLRQSQSSAQLIVSDATVSARDRPGRVDARLTLQRAP